MQFPDRTLLSANVKPKKNKSELNTGLAQLFRQMIGVMVGGVMVLNLLTTVGNASEVNSKRPQKKITIDLEKKVPLENQVIEKPPPSTEMKPADKEVSVTKVKPIETLEGSVPVGDSLADPSGKLQSFEELKDPFEAEVKNLPELHDPFEYYNRTVYKFNDALLEYVLSPAARGYGMIVPDVGRVAIKNVFSNASSPVSLLSSIAEGDIEKSATVFGRLLINTTLGLGGMFDVADDVYGIKPVSEDFDQALGSYGIPTGPYIVLPVFGPSTVRHTFGRVLDTMANPTTYFAPFAANVGAGAGNKVNTFSFDPDLKKDLDRSAVDPYESMRYFYYQRRGVVSEQ